MIVGKGDGTFRLPFDLTSGRHPQSIAAGDLNRDGRPDIVTANTASNSVTVFLSRAAPGR